jgi:purine-binding chemotaxis protein CheW
MGSALHREKKIAATVENTVQLVTFRVGSEEYGLDINTITEVIRPLKITLLPRMPKFIEGVINLRGVIIPIVDLRKRFALAEIHNEPRKMRMLIIKGAIPAAKRRGKELLGLVVDGVQEVLHVPREEIAPPPGAATGEHTDFISGMGKVGERLIIIVDIARILSQQESSALEEADNAE